jgi:hypothetical protein
VGPRAGLEAGARREILCLCRGSNTNRPARSQILYCLSYHGSITVLSKAERRSMDGISRKYILNFLTTIMLDMGRNNGREGLRKFAFFLTDLCWFLLLLWRGRYAEDVTTVLLA